ncbi:MAG: signal peptidase II [Pseudomonadota bacterium]
MKPPRLGLIIAFVILIMDQVTKWLVLDALSDLKRVVIVPGFFDFSLAWNRGVSFSMFSSSAEFMPWVLSGIAILIVLGLLWWLAKVDTLMVSCGIGMIIGGAVGNLIDRLRFGAVVDFLDFYLVGYHWPTFNIADCAVTVGVGLILLDSWLMSKQSA